MKELLCSPEVVNGGEKGEMDNDFVVEAEGELAVGGVTHCFHLAPGSNDPEPSQSKGIQEYFSRRIYLIRKMNTILGSSSRQAYLIRKMTAWMHEGPVIHDAVTAAQKGWSSSDKSK